MGSLATLRAAAGVLLERMQFMRQAGLGFAGARDYYTVLGYDRTITTRQYRDEYARGGIAKRIVEAYPKATWRGGVELFEDEDPDVSTPFEAVWKEHFERRLNVWSTFLRADILASLSTYSVILIGDGQDMSGELTRGTPEKLLYLQPYLGGGVTAGSNRTFTQSIDSDCTIAEWDVDPKSPRFGEPQTYTLRRTNIVSPAFARPIHWSRVIHVAEGCLEDNVFGIPTLENIWNLLQDLLKVTGGGAEAFWIRANQGLNLNLDKDVEMKDEDQAALKDEVDEYRHNISRVLKTRGMEVNTLGSDVANFSNPAEAILTQIAGSKGIPMRILTGSERGELASSQDAVNFNTQVQDRRTTYVGPLIVRRFVDRMIAYGYLPQPKQYDVFWPTVQTMSDLERADGAKRWAETNATNGTPVYTVAEIREHWQDLAPLSPEQVEEMAPVEDGAAQLLEGTNEEIRAAGGVGSGIPGHVTEPKDRADYAVATKTLNQVLGGPKASSAVRKRANIDTLKRVKTADLQRLKAAYETIQRTTKQQSFPLRHVEDELKFRGLQVAMGDDLEPTLRALEAAIEADDLEAIGKIVGIDAR